MADFDTILDEYLGDADDITDIRAIVRRAWFYDFDGFPIRMWQGQGRLFTADGNEWMGSIDAAGTDHHVTPAIQDGRDGSSANYTMSMTIPEIPGESNAALYESLKADQWRVNGREVTVFLALFQQGEGLRPNTPLRFFKRLTMQSPKFSESLSSDGEGKLVRSYKVSVTARDSNFGRSNTPNRVYSDAAQKERARQLGVATIDRGCEYLGTLANRTYTVP